MIPTSGLPRPEPANRIQQGFTLLEMAVALAVLALAAAMVAPSMSRMVDGWRMESDLRALRVRMGGLPAAARRLGREIVIADNARPVAGGVMGVGPTGKTERQAEEVSRLLALPPEWTLRMRTPLRIRYNGACEAADGQLETPEGVFAVTVSAPFCETRVSHAQ